MGYKCRWRKIGRDDYIEPAPMTADQIKKISNLILRPHRKTITEVKNKAGEILGYVRTGFAGQVYKNKKSGEWLHAASDWNRSDPKHGKALLALIESDLYLRVQGSPKARGFYLQASAGV